MSEKIKELALNGKYLEEEFFVQLAEDAYLAYGKTTDFKNFQGNPMPEWKDLPEKIREAWYAAADSVFQGLEAAEKILKGA